MAAELHQRLLDRAQPAHEKREPAPRNAIGQQETQFFTQMSSSNVIPLQAAGNRVVRHEHHARESGPHRPRIHCRAAAAAQAAIAPRAVAGQTSLARRPRPLVAPARETAAVLRISTKRSSSPPTTRRAKSPTTRRGAFMRLADLYAQRFANTARRFRRDRTRRVGHAVHGALSRAVPVQLLRPPASQGRQLPAILERCHGHRSRRQPALRPHRLVRRERLRLRLLQGLHRAGLAPRRGPRPRARQLPPGAGLQREAAAGRSPVSTRCRSTCRARKP